MTTEMDIMGMDERQKFAWLHANRVTLFVVGLTWIGMIVWEVFHKRFPMFLIAMVPVFAFVRFLTYRYYQRTPRENTA